MLRGRPLVAIFCAGLLICVAIGHALQRCDLEIVNRYGTLIVIVALVVDCWPLLRTKIAEISRLGVGRRRFTTKAEGAHYSRGVFELRNPADGTQRRILPLFPS